MNESLAQQIAAELDKRTDKDFITAVAEVRQQFDLTPAEFYPYFQTWMRGETQEQESEPHHVE